MTVKEIAKMIDHTVLSNTATHETFVEACEFAKANGYTFIDLETGETTKGTKTTVGDSTGGSSGSTSAGSTSTSTNKSSGTKTAAAKPVMSASGDYLTYTVQSGDSFYLIAKNYPGVSAQNIMDFNGLTSSRIHPGMKIKIPLKN